MKTTKILFVCLGNICRSPAAEGVMKKLAVNSPIEIDSAGTAGYHTGELPDARMRAHAFKRGYELTSRARKFDPSVDFEKFDRIIVMDENNLHDINSNDSENKYGHKISMMTDYSQVFNISHVPDPYYGGAEDFEKVLDILEDACAGLLRSLKIKS